MRDKMHFIAQITSALVTSSLETKDVILFVYMLLTSLARVAVVSAGFESLAVHFVAITSLLKSSVVFKAMLLSSCADTMLSSVATAMMLSVDETNLCS